MWMIRRPTGTIYARKTLAGLKAAYGGTKKQLEAEGWTFVDLDTTKENASHADD